MIDGALQRGTLVRLRRDVYLAADSFDVDERQRHLLRARAEQAINPALVATRETAALAWELPFAQGSTAPSDVPQLLAPRGGAHRSARTALAHIVVGALPDHHQDEIDGLRVTTRVRTAVDLARDCPLPIALIPLDAAARDTCLAVASVSRRRDFHNPRLHAMARSVLREAAEVSRAPSEVVTAIELVDPRRETPIESLAAGHMALAGIPLPVPQAEIRTIQGPLYPDFLWPDYRLIGEADGAVKYQTPQAMLQEKQREQVLRDLGFDFVRWTGKEIWAKPSTVMARIARALDRRQEVQPASAF